jgi:hypothetical protein
MREIAIWHEGQAEREDRRAQRVARAERRQRKREAADGGSGQMRPVEAKDDRGRRRHLGRLSVTYTLMTSAQ